MWSLLLPFVALASTLVTASPIELGELTNAELLQRGMHIKAPAKRHLASRTNALRPRQSDNVDPVVIQVTSTNPSKRDTAAPIYLTLDTTTNAVKSGSLADALYFEIGTSSVLADDELVADHQGTQYYVANEVSDLAVAGRGDIRLTTTSDAGQPIGDADQTSIWNYIASSTTGLYPDFYSNANTPKAKLYLGLDSTGALITCDFAEGLSNPVSARAISYTDAVAAEPTTPAPTKVILQAYTTDASVQTRYIQYSEPSSGLGSFDYVEDQTDATEFSIAASSSASGKGTISFVFNGETRYMGVKFQQKVCGQCPAQYQIVPTPGGYDTINTNYPIETDVWVYPSELTGITGLAAKTAGGTDIYIIGSTYYISGNQYYTPPYGAVAITPIPV